jgi:dipeptidase D
MSIYENLESARVFHFFEEISRIPHGSGNTKQISDYCVSFAQERNLNYYQDEANNVIIQKAATPGYEQSEPIIIQGHMDMVCEKEAGADFDFEKDSLILYQENDFLKAKETTLGGDDGIALAYACAILDSETIAHPPLEVIFTVDEEIGMLGASTIDVSMLKGKKLLNIDSDQEGYFLTSCAGGVRVNINLPLTFQPGFGEGYKLTISGLLGGHSGTEIKEERANAIILCGRILKVLQDQFNLAVTGIAGGQMDNVIPRQAVLQFLLDPADEQELKHTVQTLSDVLKLEFKNSDPSLSLQFEKEAEGTKKGQPPLALTPKSLVKILYLLRNIPYGVQNMSTDIVGLVETSLNPGILKINEQELLLSTSIRSSVTSRKYDLLDRITLLAEFLGAQVNTSGDYPAWEYRKDSQLREQFTKTYSDLFGKEAVLEAIHAGLECGIFCGKISGLDCISFGPNIWDIHTPQERLSISSTERVYKLLIEFLKRAK